MKNLILLSISFAFTITSWSQKAPKTQSVNIQTSAQCGDCKSRIESILNYTKGVKSSDLNLETKVVLVVYRPKKTNYLAICKAIAEIGYDADATKANPQAVSALPKCCQPGGH